MSTHERNAWFYGWGLTLIALSPAGGHASQNFQVYVTNEKSGDVTVINGGDNQVLRTIPVGKRPRGIHASPDGKTVYVALSGTPIAAPPQLDAKGNPIFQKAKDDDDDDVKADKSADAIGVLDVAGGKLTGKISAGSDPEEFSLSSDGTKIYVSNEDVKAASVINIATGKVEHIIAVGQEPEGVSTAPDGKRFYVTCEAGGDVYVVETAGYTSVGHFKVNARPRSVAFMSDTPVGFIPSESTGELNIIDTVNLKVLKVIALPPGSRPMSVDACSDDSQYSASDDYATFRVREGHDRLRELLGIDPNALAIEPLILDEAQHSRADVRRCQVRKVIGR